MRTVDLVYDQTSTAAGSLDTGSRSTTQYDALLITATTSGGAGASAFTVSLVLDDGTAIQLVAPTAPGVAATVFASVGLGGTINAPVPDFTQVKITAGTASTVRLVVHGVRTSAGAN